MFISDILSWKRTAAIAVQSIIQCFFYLTEALRLPAARVPSSNSQQASAPVARHDKSTTLLSQPATDSWPAADPRSLPSRRPTQSYLVSASRSPLSARLTRTRGGLVRRVSVAKSAPRSGANVLRPLWRAVDGHGSRSQVPEALWSSLRARLRATKPGSKRPKSNVCLINVLFLTNLENMRELTSIA